MILLQLSFMNIWCRWSERFQVSILKVQTSHLPSSPLLLHSFGTRRLLKSGKPFPARTWNCICFSNFSSRCFLFILMTSFSYQALRTRMGLTRGAGLPRAQKEAQEEVTGNWRGWLGSSEEVRLLAGRILSIPTFWNWSIPLLFDWVYPVTYF